MSENKITFPAKLASNNPKSFGIADATDISGHKSVDALPDLYVISDSVLSILKDGSDAIGQEWFVVSEDCKYRLDNWENRKSVTGWTKLPKQELINTKQSISEKDKPNGYAGLDSNGKLPIEKTYGTTATVVDVETYESLPVTGLNGVIYYVLNTGAQYKWSGSAYIDITDGADNAKKNETSIFDCSNGTSTKYYSSLSDAINVVPLVYRTSNRIISYLSTENATTTAANYQYNGVDGTTWTDLTKWERIPAGVVQTTGTSTTKVMSQAAHLKSMTFFNISALSPNGGISNGDTYDKQLAVTALISLVGSSSIKKGDSLSYKDSERNDEITVLEYFGGDVTALDNWNLRPLFKYVSNSEFIYCLVDFEGKVLYGIRWDGSIYQCEIDDKTKTEIDSLKKTDEEIKNNIVNIKEIVFPVTLNFSGAGVYKKGTSPTVTLSWQVYRNGSQVTPTYQKINNEDKSSPAIYYPISNETYNLEIEYDGIKKTASQSAIFVDASFYGMVSNDFVVNEANIKSLAENIKNTKNFTYSNISSNNQKICYAYPASFGDLSAIKDANNFEYIQSYTKTQISVNGVTYNVYLLTSATTITNFKQIYS